ncbi:MAG: hypothetical protein KDK36_19810 [Leptospiraceae bacterium]|nr:hypothetical protein [Leptospiraceae bacterium]
MDRRYLILLFLLMIFLFFFSSNSIVSIKVQELRFYLAKEQLLNYELSSKVLKEKIRQMLLSKDDYTNEIKNNILESNIMNSQSNVVDPKLDFADAYGLVIVNFVRFISMKPKLNLVEDQGDMLKIQFAFYMERTRKFPIAVKKYSELSEKLKEIETNENGFIMLHHGFCLAMIGETEAAIVKLRDTERVFAGTHFAENARILINVLLEGVRRKEDIAKRELTPAEKAKLLYENGNYKEAMDIFNSLEGRTHFQNYMRARCLEELGRTNDAVPEYVKLVEQRQDPETAKKANRRLLLIGSIYEKNEQITEFSKKQAEDLGDTEVVKQVESGTNLIAKSVVIEKLSQENVEDTGMSEEELAEINKLKEEFKTIKIEEETQRKETVDNILPPVKEEPKIIIENISIQFNLIDGRALKGKSANFEDNKIQLKSGIFDTTLPVDVLSEVQFATPPQQPTTRIYLVKTNGKTLSGTKFIKKNDELEMYFNAELKDKIDVSDIKQIYVR